MTTEYWITITYKHGTIYSDSHRMTAQELAVYVEELMDVHMVQKIEIEVKG